MPSRSRRHTTTQPTGSDNQQDTRPDRDLTNGRGNQASDERNIWDWFRSALGMDREQDTPTLDAYAEGTDQQAPTPEVFAEVADDVEGDQDALTTLDELAATELDDQKAAEAQASVFQRAGDIEKVELASGQMYKVTTEDMGKDDPWTAIARDHGMKPEHLQVFNQHVAEVNVGVTDAPSSPVTLTAGVEVYIPSAQEILFAQVRGKASSYDEAIELYGQLSEGPNVKMIDAARSRATGKVGEGYGTGGVDGGWFYTRNKTLAGASSKRTDTIGGAKEYKVFWVKDFWKCSLFLHDVVFQAGYKPHQTANNHYQLAGRLQQSPTFTEVSYDKAMPGDAFQRFGGTGSDESHNTVLSSFPEIEDLGNDRVAVRYDMVGAEGDRAGESSRESIVKKGTSDVLSGYGQGGKIRFFRPNKKQ